MDYSNLVSFHDNGQKPSTRCSFNPISLSRSESFELRFENLRSPSQKNARWKWARFTSRFFLPTSKIKSLRKFRNDRRETFFFFFQEFRSHARSKFLDFPLRLFRTTTHLRSCFASSFRVYEYGCIATTRFGKWMRRKNRILDLNETLNVKFRSDQIKLFKRSYSLRVLLLVGDISKRH